MKWKEVYSKCNHKKYSQINNIKGELKLQSNIKNFITENKIYVIITILAVIGLIMYASKLNISIILASIGLILVLVFFMTYYSTYRIMSKGDTLLVKVNMNETIIEYKDLVNIFLDKKRDSIFLFIPFYIYTLNIVFYQGETQMLMTLPTMMLKKSDVIKFFSNLNVEVLEQQKEEDKRIEQKKATRKAIIITSIVVLTVLLIVGAIVFTITSNTSN